MNQKTVKIGILGNGQLANMMAQRASNVGAEIQCLQKGDDLLEFLKGFNLATIESEFIPTEKINHLQKSHEHLHIIPHTDALEMVNNKLNQKYLFKKLGLESTPFLSFDPKMDNLNLWISKCYNTYDHQFIIKRAHGGYDGKGNLLCNEDIHRGKIIKFCQSALSDDTTVYAEPFIKFDCELAMVFCRSIKGEFINYPLVKVESFQNICKTVYGPATEFEIPKAIEDKAIEYGKKLAESIDLHGTFAIEFFYTNGELLINEMAPRVHNTGHYTQDAFDVDQFENHLNAILGKSLKTQQTQPFFMMINLLAPEGIEQHLKLSPLIPNTDLPANSYMHWYGKAEARPHRKMGHINIVAQDKQELENQLESSVELEIKVWQKIMDKQGAKYV